MKIKPVLIFALAVAAGCGAGLAQNTPAAGVAVEAPAPTVASGDEVMPLIVIDEAPLVDAIRNLARQANLNIQFDPAVLAWKADPKAPPGTSGMPVVSFRWENITPLQALRAVLSNYGLQMVQDESKIYRVTYKEKDALEPLLPPRIFTLKYSHPTNMVPFIKANLSARSQIIPDPRTSQVMVIGTEKELREVERTVESLDKAPNQVLIEARFIETLQNPSTQKGINWAKTLVNHEVKFGNTTSSSGTGGGISGVIGSPEVIVTTADGFGPIGFLNSSGLSAALSFFNQDTESETIATPRAVTLEGNPTEMSVVQNIPVFEEQQGQSTGAGVQANTVKPNYELKVSGKTLNEVGTKLVVTPKIWARSNVFLDLSPELSEEGPVRFFENKPGSKQAPTFNRRKIETQAIVPSGYTLVLGGLTENSRKRSRTKVPLLGDIPGLGEAFRSSTKERTKRELLIFVTPTILLTSDFVEAEESRDFLKQKAIEKPDVPWAPYDSSEPRDWSKPIQ